MLLPKQTSKSVQVSSGQPKSVRDYYCAEDSNAKFRPYMEDRMASLP